MITKDFAVSVQYGQGYHYFVRYDFITLDEAFKAAEIVKNDLRGKSKRRRGAIPVVHVWRRDVSMFPPSRAARTLKT